MKRKSKLIGLLTLAGFAAGLVYSGVLPWKNWLAGEIKVRMLAQGIAVQDLSVSSLTLDKVVLQNMTLGAGLTLKDLAIEYDWSSVLSGRLKILTLTDLSISVRQEEGGAWVVDGIQAQNTGAQELKKIWLPDTLEAIETIPVDEIYIKNANVSVETAQWSLSAPVDLIWHKQNKSISLHADTVSLRHPSLKMNTGALRADVAFVDGAWSGDWGIEDIAAGEYPLLAVKGALGLKARVFDLSGDVTAADNMGQAGFGFTMPVDDAARMVLSLAQGSMPWAGGRIAFEKMQMLLDGKTPIRAKIDVQNISVDTLLELVTGQSLDATGTISGKVPVIIMPDGRINLEKGRMSANDDGVISLPPQTIPGEGEQIDLTRQILENFEYDGLSIDVQELDDGKIALLLALSGKNPKVYDGRAVKLNVRLGGDVLEFLQSNLTLFTQPQSLLNQENK